MDGGEITRDEVRPSLLRRKGLPFVIHRCTIICASVVHDGRKGFMQATK